MKILITGGFGLLGSRLANHYSYLGHEVVVATSNKHFISENTNYEIKYFNWEVENDLINICRQINLVIHAAGMNASQCISDPISAYKFNCINTERLFRASILCNVNKFIFLSTAHVYSNNLLGVITEETNPSNSHPYAQTNLAAEMALSDPFDKNIINVQILRLSNVIACPIFNNTNCWDLLLNDLCKQSITNGFLEIKNEVDTKRDFIPIKSLLNIFDDLIFGIYSNLTGIINIGSNTTFKISEIANLIAERYTVFFQKNIHIKSNFEQKPINEIFEYSSKILPLKNYYSKSNLIIEIDSLLDFCNRNYIKLSDND